ncbi:hypothetical protein HanRHA438_Chr03g0120151 [Helianthus annuus]|uniref:Uncharacterized protein n=1 Tax=Helianthus annuus TaxID=4232 RepID=A0A251V6F2_HELAN|nr:hypothetical protein HanXRQr2_Chr03g0109371 [Helianthus annuus]KAJ0592936.1 hypothetical protein HanHA300_Chr03g0091411 [Helianthus annuus]KAJ0768005.1 hypothetical protein HanLR1_Chr03g0096441 [Helianthus annuus]KAJ0935491.1 hypothetical protein HanRHA438_Chr03g0120151 [Helianthus annuus]
MSFFRKFRHTFLEVHLNEGSLVCPEPGRRFPVNKGIPNMLVFCWLLGFMYKWLDVFRIFEIIEVFRVMN